MREAKKENHQPGGLFSFRKQNEKQIEEYTDEESKIKTNILEDVYRSKNENFENKQDIEDEVNIEKEESKFNYQSKPLDTTDVLEQLKKMKEKIEKELQEKDIVPETLKEESKEYKLEENNENKAGKIEENIEVNKEESKENTKKRKKII